jgi:hypothetical protein
MVLMVPVNPAFLFVFADAARLSRSCWSGTEDDSPTPIPPPGLLLLLLLLLSKLGWRADRRKMRPFLLLPLRPLMLLMRVLVRRKGRASFLGSSLEGKDHIVSRPRA